MGRFRDSFIGDVAVPPMATAVYDGPEIVDVERVRMGDIVVTPTKNVARRVVRLEPGGGTSVGHVRSCSPREWTVTASIEMERDIIDIKDMVPDIDVALLVAYGTSGSRHRHQAIFSAGQSVTVVGDDVSAYIYNMAHHRYQELYGSKTGRRVHVTIEPRGSIGQWVYEERVLCPFSHDDPDDYNASGYDYYAYVERILDADSKEYVRGIT